MKQECFLLQNAIHADVDGSVRVCCLSQKELPTSKLGDSRDQLIASPGWYEDNCARCIEVEEKGATSMRNHMNEIFNGRNNFYYLDIRYSNQCNMACAMCTPTYSSLWESLTESSETSHAEHSGEIEELIRNISPERDIYVHFAGGEPLLIEKHFEFLDLILSSRDQQAKVEVQWTSNLSVLPQKFMDIFERVDNVRLIVSVDAVDEEFDYIRFPGKFTNIRKNLKKLVGIQNLEIVIQPTLCLFNIFGFADLIQFYCEIENQMFPEKCAFVPHPLIEPFHLNLFRAPNELKGAIDSELEKLILICEGKKGLEGTRQLLKSILRQDSGGRVELGDSLSLISQMNQQRKTEDLFKSTRLFSQLQKTAMP